MTPETMKAIKIVSAGKAEIQTVFVPKLRDDYILVKVNHVAINPTDWKHIDVPILATPGVTVGCDFAGTVAAVGSKVTKDYKPGDRISGGCHGSNLSQPEDGAFGEYCVAKEGATCKIPDNMSDAEAATSGVAIVTVALAFYKLLEMPFPGSQKPGEGGWLLVYGGSTATGSVAIQSAVLSGYKVVTTCSPRNFDFVKSLGAESAFDYNDPECSKKINQHTGDSLKLALDCVAEGTSPDICAEALSSSGGKFASLLPSELKNPRADVQIESVNGYTCLGEPFTKFGQDFPSMPENYHVASEFFEIASKLFAEGKLVAHPQKVNVGGEGFEDVLNGLQTMRDGKVSGFKLVYKFDDSN